MEKKAVGGQTKDCDVNPMEKLGYNQAKEEILKTIRGEV